MATSRGRSALFAAVALSFMSVLTLGAVELVLRVLDYPPEAFSPWIRSDCCGFRLAPGVATHMRGPEYDVEVKTNSLGMRDEELAPKSGPRVLLLGDSYTMGYGVDRGKIFADLLQKDLGVDVVNAGTGGYEIVHQTQLLPQIGKQVAPDLVVFVLYLGNDLAQNDEWELRGDGTLHSLVREYPVRQQHEVKLWRLFRDFAYGVRLSRGEKEGEWMPFDSYLGLCEREPGAEARKDYDDADRWIGKLADETKALGVPLFVLMVPYRSMVEPDALASLRSKVPDLDSRYDLTLPAREIGKRMAARGIDFADSTPALVDEQRRSGKALFFPIDGHPNAAGHEAIERFALPLLRERLAKNAHL